MNARRSIPALLASAAFAALAAPAFAETIYIETVPATTTYVPSTTYYYSAPAETTVYSEPAIVVTPRTDDVAINNSVVDTLAADPHLSGNIGVETFNRNVELTGRVTTEGQALRAERDAKSVYGVDAVQNLITPRVGRY